MLENTVTSVVLILKEDGPEAERKINKILHVPHEQSHVALIRACM
jgi:hypothetical protein